MTNKNNEIITLNKCDSNAINLTLLVGPSFCGKTYLLLSRIKLIQLDDPLKRIYIITRSPK